MTLIVCVDDRLGMLFNKRRQSRDSAVCERILAVAANRTVWVSTYSASLFDGAANLCIDDAYAQKATGDDVCFVENGLLPLDHADRLILYRWGRHYPADVRFPAEPEALGFEKIASTILTGHSHDSITEDIYIKRGGTA